MIGSRFEQPTDDDLDWDNRKRFEWDGSGNCIYKAWARKGTSESEEKWWIMKFTYTSGNVTAIDTAYGAWSNRASLTYL